MKFIFFQLNHPYQELTQNNYIGHDWVSGMTGPLDIKEAKRLASTFGGQIVETENYDFINSPHDLIHLMDEISENRDLKTLAKLAGVTEDREEDEIKEEISESFNAVPFKISKEDEVKETPRVLPEIPEYREMMAKLVAAKEDGEFDYLEFTGNKRDKDSITEAYLAYLDR